MPQPGAVRVMSMSDPAARPPCAVVDQAEIDDVDRDFRVVDGGAAPAHLRLARHGAVRWRLVPGSHGLQAQRVDISPSMRAMLPS